jgi:hypothetical protein
LKTLGAIIGGFLAVILTILLYLLYLVVSIGVLVGAVWVVCKIFGFEIEGFTAVALLS